MTVQDLESALAAVESDAEAAAKTAAMLVSELRKLKRAAAVGDVRALRRLLSAAGQSAREAERMTRELGQWELDEVAYLASGAFHKAVLRLAEAEGMSVFEVDDRLLSYPVLVEVVPKSAAVRIDRKLERRIRPSALVRCLKAAQSRKPRFRPEAFLESLAAAYDLLVARSRARPGDVQRLVDLHATLTLLPGQSREYPRAEFTRDLYLLDRSGVIRTKDGRTLSLPASTMTKGSGVLMTVTQSGQQKLYAGIAFA